MSVTITIQGNHEHCEENGLIKKQAYECDCTYLAEDPHPECRLCGGTGQILFNTYPFEMNLANGNFYHLWEVLGLNPDPECLCGEIDPLEIKIAIEQMNPFSLMREDNQIAENITICGVTTEQAARYCDNLWKMVLEAIEREKTIVWS